MIRSEYQLGILYMEQKRDSLTLAHLQHALDFARSEGNSRLICIGYLNLAGYFRHINNPRRAIDEVNKALAIAEENDLRKLRGEACYKLGHAYSDLGWFDKALEKHFEALRISEELGAREENAEILNAIGSVYKKSFDYDNALLHINRALEINRSVNNINGIAANMVNIGAVRQKQGRHEEALRIYHEVLPVTREAEEHWLETITTGNIGSSMVDQGKLQEGLEYLRQVVLKPADIAINSMDEAFLTRLMTILEVNYERELQRGATEPGGGHEPVTTAP